MIVSRYLPVVARLLMGALFAFSGLNKLIPFGPMPAMPPDGAAFLAALAATGYFIPLLGAVEVVAGLALISGRFVPLALVVLAPIVVHIALFHTLLVPAPSVTIFLLGSGIYLAWVYRVAFLGVLAPQPSAAGSHQPELHPQLPKGQASLDRV